MGTCVCVPAGLSELQLISTFCLFALGAGKSLTLSFRRKEPGAAWSLPCLLVAVGLENFISEEK